MWLQLCAIVLGVWLMISPGIVHAPSGIATVWRIAGPLAIWVGVLALRSVTRPFRALHFVSGLLLVIAPWELPGPDSLKGISALIGCALFFIGTLRGPISQRVDGGWRAVLRPWRAYRTQSTPTN